MVKAGVTITVDKVPQVLEGLRYLDTHRVMVGIPSAKAGRKEGPINNAALGFIHENGAPEVNIPARPWLIPGVATATAPIAERFKVAGTAALEGQIDRVQKIFMAIGLMGQNAAKAKIRTGPFAPLSPRTIAKRKARGVTRTKPLIDTAQMLNAVSFVVRKIKGLF